MEIVTKHAFEVVSDEEVEESTHFFEGAEKLLEIWFNKEANPMATSLRAIPLAEVEALLEIACCHILHFRTNGFLDSYVLSESSMFITDTRIILKTCGNTKLLEAIDRLLELAKTYANMDTVANVYYSRKNFLRPELQPFLHQNFENEVEHLDNFFEEGAAYCMGSLKQHRWYLYTMSAPEAPTSPFPDHTLEICMTKIPENILRIFSRETCKDGAEATRRGGIDKLVPAETIIHEELFDPVGYSMNGLLPNSDEYVTIHITPEPDFCYISFETNQRQECLYQQSLKVLECFQPNEFLMTVFANDKSKAAMDAQLEIWNQDIPGYRRASLQFLRLQFDTLVYAQFVRRDATITAKYLPKKRKLVACCNTDTEDEASNE